MVRIARVGVAVASGLVAAGLVAGPARAPEPARTAAAPGQIAVSLAIGNGAEGSGGLALIDPAGRRLRVLTKPRARREDSEPAWSPDGRWLAFTRTADGRRSFHVYLMRADGTAVRRLTGGRFDYSPAWSPDGRWIAYRSNAKLRIVHPDGTGGRAVPVAFPAEVEYPAWAPGGRISYSNWASYPGDAPAACGRPAAYCGYVVSLRLDGSNRRRVVRGRDAHWSPDARAIVYTGPDGGVYAAPGRGGSGHLLGRGYRAEWSPGGEQIVYARMGAMPSRDSVWIMNRDGTRPHRILGGGSDPSWRP